MVLKMLIYIILGAFLAGVNIAGLVMLYIQKKEKNLSPCERSFSDTNARTDTERAAMLYALEQYKLQNEKQSEQNPDSGVIEKIHECAEVLEVNENDSGGKDDNKSNDPLKPKSKRLKKDKSKKPVSDFSIFILAALGGAFSIYAGMFFMKYKLKNIFYMVLIPTIIGLNIYCAIKLLNWQIVWGAVENFTAS